MDRKITNKDLISYHYNEANQELSHYISDNIAYHGEWADYLKLLRQIDATFRDNKRKGPSPTTLRIILEESQHQENPTY